MIGLLGLPDVPPGDAPRLGGSVGIPDGPSRTGQFLRELARAFDLLVSGQTDDPTSRALASSMSRLSPGAAPPGPGPRPPEHLRELLVAAARQEGVPPALLAAVVELESGFNPRAISPAGAKGLTQLMDGTARALGVTDPYDPWQNLVGGARYLREQLGRFSGNVALALAAYNAGPAAIEAMGRQIPPYPETQVYVSRALAAYRRNIQLGGDR